MTEQKNSKRSPLNIQIILVLNEVGCQEMKKISVNLVTVQTTDGYERLGLSLIHVNAKLMQKLIISSFLHEIQFLFLKVKDIRMDLIDLIKIFFFASIYKNSNLILSKNMFLAEYFIKYNIVNNIKLIPTLDSIKISMVKIFFEKNPALLKGFKERLIDELRKILDGRVDIPKISLDLIRKSLFNFVEQIDIRIWYIYNLFLLRKVNSFTIHSIALLLVKNLELTRVGVALSSSLIEVLEKLEGEYLNSVAKKSFSNLYRNDVVKFLSNSENKKIVYDYAEQMNEKMMLTYSFLNRSSINRDTNKIEVLCSVLGRISPSLEKALNKQMFYYSTKDQNLAELYHSLNAENALDDSSTDLNNTINLQDLGLFYLSFMKELCNGLELKFNCSVKMDIKRERTELRFTIIF